MGGSMNGVIEQVMVGEMTGTNKLSRETSDVQIGMYKNLSKNSNLDSRLARLAKWQQMYVEYKANEANPKSLKEFISDMSDLLDIV